MLASASACRKARESGVNTSHLLKEGYDLAGEHLGLSEALRVEHHLSDELAVGARHREAAEQLLEVVGQVGAARVAGVHRDEDRHVWVDLHRLVNQLDADVRT